MRFRLLLATIIAATAALMEPQIPLSARFTAGSAAEPRVAPDEARANCLLDAWFADSEIQAAAAIGAVQKSERLTYGSDMLHGTLCWAEGLNPPQPGVPRPPAVPRPGVLLVHTAVGPHDLFLQWKAQRLAACGYAVLIVDMLGDDDGSGWEREWSLARRAPFWEDDTRAEARRRMAAAHEALVTAGSVRVDGDRIAALGYCLGGRLVLDYARGNPNGLVAVASFHGILDGSPLAPGVSRMRAAVLLCHGDADPFVPEESVQACTAQLRDAGARWSLLQFGGVRHGFTNPAQALNPAAESFGYDAEAAEAAWAATMEMLGRNFEV